MANMSDGWAILPSRGERALANTSDELTGYEVVATDLEPCLGRLAVFCTTNASSSLTPRQFSSNSGVELLEGNGLSGKDRGGDLATAGSEAIAMGARDLPDESVGADEA
jgi:hypothetical protein